MVRSVVEPRKVSRYGWRPSPPDHRRWHFSDHRNVFTSVDLSDKVDLRLQCPPVYDQSELGGCVSNALAGLVQFILKKEGKSWFTSSRLFNYYNTRVIEGSVNEDAGASIADGVNVLRKIGAPRESLWWYNITKFKVKPNQGVYADAALHKVSRGLSLDNTKIDELRTCLAGGSPFALGFSVYESFESDEVAKTGLVPLPKKDEQQLGGHAVLAVGYEHSQKLFIVRNSWGTSWGLGGYFLMPYDYITNTDLSGDFWTIDNVS